MMNNVESTTPQELQEISQRIGISLQWIAMNRPDFLGFCRVYLNTCLTEINNLITHN